MRGGIVDVRRWLATAAHASAGVVGTLGILVGLILLRATPGWESLGILVALGALAIGLEGVANRLGPATVPSSHRARAIGTGVGFGAIPFLLGLVLLVGQADTTALHLAGDGLAPAIVSCCRGDFAFPLGGTFVAWGLWSGLALGQSLPTAITVTAVSLVGFGSRLTVAVGGVTKVVGPVRRHVPLRRDTFVAIVGATVVLRHDGRGFRIHLHRWGEGAILPHMLHRALHLSGVPGSYNELRRPTVPA